MDLAWIDSLPEEARAALRQEIEQTLSQTAIEDYRPYEKQMAFHRLGLMFRERLLRAGNQNGKTFAMGCEAAYHLSGDYPDWWDGRVWDRPIVCWASGETGEATRDNAQRTLVGPVGARGTGTIKAHLLGEPGSAHGTADLLDYIRVKHVSGGWSLLRFKHYAQGRAKWQGPPVDLVWFDEEPPPDIYDEGLARTIATGGMVALTFTPLLGMSDVVRRFLMNPTDDRAEVVMTIYDAEHIPPERKEKIIASFPAHQRDARAMGIPVLGSGQIFPVDEETIKVNPFSIPPHWPLIGGIDFGWDHPTAAALLAWDRDRDCVYVVSTHRVREQTPLTIAPILKQWAGDWLPWAWPPDGLQHDKSSGMQLAKQYKAQGLNMLEEHAQYPPKEEDEEDIEQTRKSRVSVEAGVMDMLDRMQTGRFKVFSNNPDVFEEVRYYHRKDGKIVKERDDLISAIRYAIMSLRYAATKPAKMVHRRKPRRVLDSEMGV